MLLDKKPLLQHVYDALRTVFEPENLVVATSAEATDDAIADFCERNQISCYRGDLTNVSERFISAAETYHFDYAMRINGDNLFVALDVVKKMIDEAQPTIDFYSNVPERTFPYGMSAELVKTQFYRGLMNEINASPQHKEHVTLYLYDHPEIGKRKYFYNQDVPEASGLHLSVDTPADADFAIQMLQHLASPLYTNSLTDIVKTYHQLKTHE